MPEATPQFSAESLKKIEDLKTRYPEGKQKSAILPVLHMAQKELGGWLSVPVMDYVAGLLQMLPIEVYEVATFYTMFNLKPTGQYVLEVCQTGPCCLLGAEKIITHLETKLGVKVGGTSADGLFTLKTVECLASCGTGPVLQLGESYLENLSEARMDEILDQLREQAKTKVSL